MEHGVLAPVKAILHPAIVKRDNPLFEISFPGTHRMQEFLITQGGIVDLDYQMFNTNIHKPLVYILFDIRQQLVDSWHGGSANVMKIPPIEKKVGTRFFLF